MNFRYLIILLAVVITGFVMLLIEASVRQYREDVKKFGKTSKPQITLAWTEVNDFVVVNNKHLFHTVNFVQFDHQHIVCTGHTSNCVACTYLNSPYRPYAVPATQPAE